MTNPTEDGDESVATPLPSDFFQGDVAGGLEKMRRRLLDLTKRNRLLNYRYSKKGALRVVDELPDQLFEQLVDGRELYFKPVARPPGWRGQRAGAEPLPGFQQPSAAQHAESLGIRTSFDLPQPLGNGHEPLARHSDRAIQTLLYPEDLEGVLRSLASAARLTIEETGTNMLYLAFGFLDWYARDDSEQVATAPLILLPVSLRKADADTATRAYRYAIKYSEEDILANISLQELLKQDFGVQLPDFDEEQDGPESYFAKLKPILAQKPQWRLRRHLTLTLLSFGKLLMYRDLDPTTWPKDKGPAQHKRIREFFEGRENSSIDFAEEYSLDAPLTPVRVPEIVDEADSSQHSALVDAVAGKNLVIAGPPGTGKSQTITNLIAAAMADGKRVLFVSEKLAALEVVRHRLERVGLGAFCLELHSHKSKKRALLDDIEARLNKQRSFSDPVSLQDKLKALENTKTHLSGYAHLINQPFGAQHQVLFDVIWAAARAKAALARAVIAVLARARVRNAGAVTMDETDAMVRSINQYSKHFDAVTTSAPLADHPWYGLRNTGLTFRDEQTVCDSLRSASTSFVALGDAIRVTNALISDGAHWLENSIKALNATIGIVGTLAVPSPFMRELLPRLDQTGALRRVTEFIEWLESWHQLIQRLASLYGKLPPYNDDTIRNIKRSLDIVADTAPAIRVVADTAGVARLASDASRLLHDGSAVVKELQPLLGIDVANDANAAPVTATLESLAVCPVKELPLRHDGLTGANVVEVLTKAAAEAAAVREMVAKLSRRIDLALAPRNAELRTHLVAMTHVRWWSLLRSDFRQARRAYRAMARSESTSITQMQSDYRALLELERARTACEQNSANRSAAGPHFNGIESPFEDLSKVAHWRTVLRGRLLPLGKQGEEMAETLWVSPSELLTVFATVESTSPSRKSRHDAAIEQLGRARTSTGSADLQEGDWLTLVPTLAAISSRLDAAGTYLSRNGVPATLQIAMRSDLEADLLARNALQSRIDGAVDVSQLLGSDFSGTETSLTALRATVQYWRSVSQAELPGAVRNWLLQSDADDRLNRLQHYLSEAAAARDQALRLWTEFTELGAVKINQWNGEIGSIETRKIDAFLQRSRLALENAQALSGWLDYLHAADDLKQRELYYLADLVEQGQLPSSKLEQAFAFVHSNSLVQEVFEAHPQLARFSGLTHEQTRKRYMELDKECIKLYRSRAAARIGARRVPDGVGYGPAAAFTERHLLEREIGKQKRHIPLRQLMKRAGNALQALKPCFMMGPLSVAQYLQPGVMAFDLLIVDEASQLRPQDALGAIARVEQVVIVGDQMQLPPTSFFDRLGDEEDDEEAETSAIEDSESILDVASSLYRPGRMLRWHYRSRHGSLIAFSNKEFYKNDLIVFPSPAPKSRTLGVKFIHVPDGVFENRRNKVEAQRIVLSALRQMEQRTSETLGIVAMNAPQRELIEELLERQLKEHPAADEFVRQSQEGLEPLFVKNLENVQGDERDVIFISATYGKTADGHFHHRFGPILSHTGHRRLNVLFTRARKRVVLFSSMKAEDIKVKPGSGRGLTALKGYLSYAETGILESAQFTGREPDSDFELEVADTLRAHGLEVVAQVGVAGYFLDLAIKHPDRQDAFILGIECDGATYHSSLSARDRDRLRQTVLEDLGWAIHRVWSTDWLKQRDGETERILQRIEQLRRQPTSENGFDESLGEADLETVANDLESEDAWVDEVRAQPLAPQQVREQLLQLHEAIALSDPSIRAADSLLRSEMIELLVRTKPRTQDEWKRAVPFEMRMETNGDHVTRYLSRVIDVTCRSSR